MNVFYVKALLKLFVDLMNKVSRCPQTLLSMCVTASNPFQNQSPPFLQPPTVKVTVHCATSRYLFESAQIEVVRDTTTLKDPEIDGIRAKCEK